MAPRRHAMVLAVAGMVWFAQSEVAAQPRKSRHESGGRAPATIKEGDAAPDFTLKSLDGKESVTLSGFQGKKPVALIFGSYT